MKKAIRLLPALLQMILIFYLSSQPTNSIQLQGAQRFLFFKSLHLIFYGVLYYLLYWGTKNIKVSFFVAILYGISDEYHQTFVPGRTGQASDILIDSLGVTLVLLLTQKIRYSKQT